MLEVKGNIWDYWIKGHWIVIPTNGFIKRNGECVMGRGLAEQAKNRFPELPLMIGTGIKTVGNIPLSLTQVRLFTFPVKHNWWEQANLQLIQNSCKELNKLNFQIKLPVYIPRVGCGNGKRDWNLVRPILEKYLDSRFIICNL